MTELQAALHSAVAFANTLPSTGTLTLPSPDKRHILAARDGVFTHAVRAAILDIRAESITAADFNQKTGGVFDADEVDALIATSDQAACVAFADRVIRQYGSAESFVKHLG